MSVEGYINVEVAGIRIKGYINVVLTIDDDLLS